MNINEKLAAELSIEIISNSKELNTIVGKMKENHSKEEYEQYIKKISHVMALNFDILDMLGKEYPHLNPYENIKK